MQRPFILSAAVGIPLILVGLLMTLIGPPPAELDRGFFSPVLAFEFATEVEHVNQIFAEVHSSAREAAVRTMTNSTRLDFIFLILYGAFLLTFAATCALLTDNKYYYSVAVLAVVAPSFDLLENLQMFSIMEQLDSGPFVSELRGLQIYTWLKWGALAFSFLLLIPFLWSAGKFGRFLSFFAAALFSLGILAFVRPGLINELFAISTILMFLFLSVFSSVYRTKPVTCLPASIISPV